jgi:hypothetical protein
MKVEKEQRHVRVVFANGTAMEGDVHINPGERISDFLNKERDDFIVLTGVNFPGKQDGGRSFIINKAAITFLEER